VKELKWVLDPAGTASVHAEPDDRSKVLGTKSSGEVVCGYSCGGWLKLANEPGYIGIQIQGGAPDVVRVSWQSFAEGVLDAEAAAEQLLLGRSRSHMPEEISMQQDWEVALSRVKSFAALLVGSHSA